ncbi:CNNM domain-containing protein [Mycoplasma sp. U97]|uniref:CNNM domain-containing protein n=1 Tax=Mycoplasma tauri TaxID=547987 RepID=UPI001CC0F783|nr:CNNM domain-containing protein [Mycoplasma tauri]MBZ4212817.1 CNNM domain-containing protein [Mycoplasma tauri]
MPDYLKVICVAGLIILIIFSGVFSACETAYTSINPGKIEAMVQNKEFGAKAIKKQHKFFNQLLSTILICNNIVNIAASSIMSYLLTEWWLNGHGDAESYTVIISTAVMTPLIVLFGEITPKLIAKKHPIGVAKVFCYFIELFFYVFWIFTFPISKIGKNIYITNAEKDVKGLIHVAQNEGVLETNESIMAQNALDLDSTKVSKHFIRIKDVEYVNYNDSVSDAIAIFKETNYSRLPVRKNDTYIGIIHLKDIFFLSKGKVINYLKPIPRVSKNTNLSLALEKMRSEKAQMAFVTDNNYSDIAIGIITIEDIIEEIIGEIYDEFDNDEWEDFFEISLELFHASGKLKMKDVINRIGLNVEDISDEEKDLTIYEFIRKRVGYEPRKNTRYSFDDIHLRVLAINNRKNFDAKIEIELGNKTGLNDEETYEYNDSDK